jgi:hypothetical protein
MAGQPENQQYRKPQPSSGMPEDKSGDKKQGTAQGKKTWTSDKETDNKRRYGSDDSDDLDSE